MTSVVNSTGTIDFYPRSPCGERPSNQQETNNGHEFLSTLSLRRATWPGLLARPFFLISIHALLAESDKYHTADRERACISIHALLAESDIQNAGACLNILKFLSTLSLRRATHRAINIQSPTPFLSTLSLRRATRRSVKLFRQNYISIHALLAESDARRASRQQPAGISIHALLAESDC